MMHLPLPLENASLELTPRWSGLGMPGAGLLLGLLFVVPALLVLLLSRYEMRLVRLRVALVLLSLRLLVLGCLWFVIGLEPTIARLRVEEVPGQVIVAVDLSGSMDVADPPGKDARTRKELVRKILIEDGLLRRLAEKHRVKLFGFHRQLWEVNPDHAEDLFTASPSSKPADNLATNLQLPVQRAGETNAAGPMLGLILLTDGQHNLGSSPLERLNNLDRPIYPVVIGGKNPPPDLAVVEVAAPDNVFKDTEVKVDARIRSTGLPDQEVFVELVRKGKPVLAEHKKVLKAGQERVTFHVRLEELGTHPLEVKVRPEPAEITQANNSMARVVRVNQDRAKVLIVEEEARWEYLYLVNSLMRDKTPKGEPTLLVERILFRQPRLGLIAEEALEKVKQPRLKLPAAPKDAKQADPLSRHDVVFLGDVALANLPLADRRRLERFVAQEGGTLVMQAGKRSWPFEYLTAPRAGASDPLVKMLPINEARVLVSKPGFVLGLTHAGQAKTFLQMDNDPAKNQQFWSDMPRHFWAVVGKPKPGAAVLAFAAEEPLPPGERERLEKEQGLIVAMPYGFGQVVYVGLDSTWRWRYRVGDDYHHHFWGQLVRWAAADRMLPAGNRYVRYGSRSPIYRQGKEVDIAVRLSDEAGQLPAEATPAVRIVRLLQGGKEEKLALLPLAAKEQLSILEGKVRDLPPGQYRIDLEIPELHAMLTAPSDPPEENVGGNTFTVLPPEQEEMLDLSANWSLLADLAKETKGELFTAANAMDLVDRLALQVAHKKSFERERLWQDVPMVWWTLGVLLTLLTLEWVVRKGAGLP